MKRLFLLLAWLAVLGASALWLWQNLRTGADLTAFLPAEDRVQDSALLDELRQGAATRLILIALQGADEQQLASASKQLAGALRGHPQLRRIDNGQRGDGEELLELAQRHRYLLTPNDLAEQLSEAGLRRALRERLRDLGSAMEMAVKDLLPQDPTHETLAVLEQWRPGQEPDRRHGVWFDTAGQRALLVADTVAPGFDLDNQALAIAALQQAFAQLERPDLRMLLTGPGPFGVMLRDTTRREAQLFSTLAVGALLLFLFLTYRSLPLLLYGGMPLLSGLLAGLLSVQLLFGGIHGITLAFGVTLLGVAIDYPLHLFSHRRAGQTARASMHGIWPTLRLGVLSTCIAYLTLLLSEFPGLAQLGLFTVVGLLVAAATTRWMLPPLLNSPRADAAPALMQRWLGLLDSARLPVASLWLLLIVAVLVIALGRETLWQNDLAALTPVPAELQTLDAELRRELGAAELRHLVVIEAADQESLLRTTEQAAQRLQGLVERGELRGFDHAARFVPSGRSQLARLAALPTEAELRARLQVAAQGLPFRDGLFAPMVADIKAAGQRPFVEADSYADTPLQARLDSLLKPGAAGWRSLIPLRGLESMAAVSSVLGDLSGVQVVDLKTAAEVMVVDFRGETLWRIAAAGLAIVLIALWGLPRARVPPVLLPVLTTVLVETALFRLAGLPLSLFHLVSLMLVGGIVLDYALFFNRQDPDYQERLRTLHAISVCGVSTLTVFGILALSEIPVLRAIGVTVAAGVILGYALTALTAQGAARQQPDEHASTKTQ